MSFGRFSVKNPVLVNCIMLLILFGGVYSGLTLVRAMFPEFRPDVVIISAPYPGATPAEVEKGLALRIEEAVKDVQDVEKVTTTINEGLCIVAVELESGAGNIDLKVTEFDSAVSAIPRDELPEEAEEIRVTKAEPRLPVIAVTIFGDIEPHALKALGIKLRDDLLRLPDITSLEMGGIRKAELAVEVEPERLIEYNLSLAGVAETIRQANLDLPAGQIRSPDQNIAVRTLGESDEAEVIAETILRTSPDGDVVRVRDVGRVIDGFEDAVIIGRFNGRPAVSATVYKTDEQDAVRIARNVKAFVAGKLGRPLEDDGRSWLGRLLGQRTETMDIHEQSRSDPFPAGLQVRTHSNLARFIVDRLDLLIRNGLMGLVLVLGCLLLFLEWRVALWVMMGVVVALSGTFVLMQALGLSLNLITMFGLILVLGIVVDDAIVVGENIYARIEAGQEPHEAAIAGTDEVTWPVIAAVTTTIGAFVPLAYIEGRFGDFMGVLPIVVACALALSLFEALIILPSHLAEGLRPRRRGETDVHGAGGVEAWLRSRLARSNGRGSVLKRVQSAYAHVVATAASWRYVTIGIVLSAAMLAAGAVGGGLIPFVFVQKIDSETLLANIDMPVGTPSARTLEAMAVIEAAALELSEVETVWALCGAQIDADETGASTSERSHVAQLIIELKPLEARARSSDDVIAELRRASADIPGVESLTFRPMQGGPAGKEIELEVTGEDMQAVLAAAEAARAELATYEGVYDLKDDYQSGRREVQIELLDSARSLGLSTRALATEVRGAIYGLEARTLQRKREDVDIRVRFPEARRRQVYELERMRVATPAGHMVPFSEVARLVETRGAASIRRVDQRRAVVVSADVDQARGNAEDIIAGMTPLCLNLQAKNPGVRMEFTGNKRETLKSLGSLKRDMLIALVVIYLIICAVFNSYVQPLIVMISIPFGMIGAVFGHLVMGFPLTMMSMIGVVALAGIAVNDAIVLVDFVNSARRGGMSAFDAVVSGCVRRLRPIFLTTITTILGIAPLMMETSFQAKFLIPMAVSISFGLAFSTLLTLLAVPAGYMIAEDIKGIVRRVWYGQEPAVAPAD